MPWPPPAGWLTLLGLWLGLPQPPPPASDVGRFPSPDVVQAARQVNRRHRQHWEFLVDTLRPWRATPDTDALAEFDLLFRAWDALDNAQRPLPATLAAGVELYGDLARRYWLGELRRLIGEEGYGAGVMPPFVPVWRYSVCDRHPPEPPPDPEDP